VTNRHFSPYLNTLHFTASPFVRILHTHSGGHTRTHTGTREKYVPFRGRHGPPAAIRFVFIRTDRLVFVDGDLWLAFYSFDSGRLAWVAAPAEAVAIDIFAILDLGDGVPTGRSGRLGGPRIHDRGQFV
jgi:hypothetical protein